LAAARVERVEPGDAEDAAQVAAGEIEFVGGDEVDFFAILDAMAEQSRDRVGLARPALAGDSIDAAAVLAQDAPPVMPAGTEKNVRGHAGAHAWQGARPWGGVRHGAHPRTVLISRVGARNGHLAQDMHARPCGRTYSDRARDVDGTWPRHSCPSRVSSVKLRMSNDIGPTARWRN